MREGSEVAGTVVFVFADDTARFRFSGLLIHRLGSRGFEVEAGLSQGTTSRGLCFMSCSEAQAELVGPVYQEFCDRNGSQVSLAQFNRKERRGRWRYRKAFVRKGS